MSCVLTYLGSWQQHNLILGYDTDTDYCKYQPRNHRYLLSLTCYTPRIGFLVNGKTDMESIFVFPDIVCDFVYRCEAELGCH